jgi:elongation factor Ts
MTISAALVKELRERTGAGMMDCKKALTESDGDIDKAIEHMRKTGLAKADKKAGRTAAEGRIVINMSADNKKAVIVEVNCETDFVARDENFVAFTDKLAELALAQDINDINALANGQLGDKTVDEARRELVNKIGENIQLRRLTLINSANTLGQYSHGGRIGVVVEVEGGEDNLAKDLAMHIAASKPIVVNPEDVPAAAIEQEREIFIAQARESGKPEEIIEKMIVGKINKFLSENSLVGQPFVKDPDQTIAKVLQAQKAKALQFIRYEVGEGIEKEEDNFVAEVMAQVQES